MNAIRSIGSVLIAFLLGGLVIGAIQLVGMLVFPLPGEMNMTQFEALSWEEKQKLLYSAPPQVFAPVLLGYLVGMLVAGAVATRLWPGRSLLGAMIVGGLFTLVNGWNVYTLPQPTWVSIASFVIFIPAALVGGWMARPKQVAAS